MFICGFFQKNIFFKKKTEILIFKKNGLDFGSYSLNFEKKKNLFIFLLF